MWMADQKWLKNQQGIVSIEVALIFPVLLFILIMFFELARIALVISVVNLSIERAMQDFRTEDNFYTLSETELESSIRERIIAQSFALVSDAELSIELRAFENLGDFIGENEADETDDASEQQHFTDTPILDLNVVLTQDFMTPLPALFSLGHSYQHECQQLLGDLMAADFDS